MRHLTAFFIAVILAVCCFALAGQARADSGLDQVCKTSDGYTDAFTLQGNKPFWVIVSGTGEGTARLYYDADDESGESDPAAIDDAQDIDTYKRAEAGAVFSSSDYKIYVDVTSGSVCVEVVQ